MVESNLRVGAVVRICNPKHFLCNKKTGTYDLRQKAIQHKQDSPQRHELPDGLLEVVAAEDASIPTLISQMLPDGRTLMLETPCRAEAGILGDLQPPPQTTSAAKWIWNYRSRIAHPNGVYEKNARRPSFKSKTYPRKQKTTVKKLPIQKIQK